MTEVRDYPCDICGYDGPHAAHYDDALGQWIAECGDCAQEFGVPKDAIS